MVAIQDVEFWFMLSCSLNVTTILLAMYWNNEAQRYKEFSDYNLTSKEHWRQRAKYWLRKLGEESSAKNSLIQQCKYWAKKARSK